MWKIYNLLIFIVQELSRFEENHSQMGLALGISEN
jgi:hypothetical protein